MSEFQSNYPRGPKLGLVPVNIAALQRTALSGLVWVIANGVLLLVILIVAIVGQNSESIFAVVGFLALVWMGTSLGITYCVGSWIHQAHQAVCSLRGIEPKMSSFWIGVLAAIPFIFFGLPLAYALEFILIRSESPDKPTMRWYSFSSKSGAANMMALLVMMPSVCFICLFIPGLQTQTKYLFSLPALFCTEFGLIYGSTLVFQINKRIELLQQALANSSNTPLDRDEHIQAGMNLN